MIDSEHLGFICKDCAAGEHELCPGRSHCDCHHKPIKRPEPGTPNP